MISSNTLSKRAGIQTRVVTLVFLVLCGLVSATEAQGGVPITHGSGLAYQVLQPTLWKNSHFKCQKHRVPTHTESKVSSTFGTQILGRRLSSHVGPASPLHPTDRFAVSLPSLFLFLKS